jgi:hypothetical protein
MIIVITKTTDGTNSGLRRMRLVLKFPARTLFHIARSITIRTATPPYSSKSKNESNAAPMTYSLQNSY